MDNGGDGGKYDDEPIMDPLFCFVGRKFGTRGFLTMSFLRRWSGANVTCIQAGNNTVQDQ